MSSSSAAAAAAAAVNTIGVGGSIGGTSSSSIVIGGGGGGGVGSIGGSGLGSVGVGSVGVGSGGVGGSGGGSSSQRNNPTTNDTRHELDTCNSEYRSRHVGEDVHQFGISLDSSYKPSSSWGTTPVSHQTTQSQGMLGLVYVVGVFFLYMFSVANKCTEI